MLTGEESTRPRLNTDSDIISMFARPSCPKPPMFPIESTLALYSTLSIIGPLICGFNEQEKGCFIYQFVESNWIIERFSLLENRAHASSVSYGNDEWLITGGQDYHEGVPVILTSSEILRNMTFTHGPMLPIPLSGHCSVKINEDQIFIAGGYGEHHLKDSFVLNIKGIIWDHLPLMKYGRFGHACGKTVTLFDEIEIVVAGGLHQHRLEKYSIAHHKWFTLPTIEEQPIFKSATVQGETTFIITGGVELEPHCTTTNCRQDIIKIYDNHINTLIKKKQKMIQGRGNHVATPIPLDVDCSGKNSY